MADETPAGAGPDDATTDEAPAAPDEHGAGAAPKDDDEPTGAHKRSGGARPSRSGATRAKGAESAQSKNAGDAEKRNAGAEQKKSAGGGQTPGRRRKRAPAKATASPSADAAAETPAGASAGEAVQSPAGEAVEQTAGTAAAVAAATDAAATTPVATSPGTAAGEGSADGVDAEPPAGEAGARRPGALRRALSSRRAPRLRTGIAAFLVVAALLGVMVSALALWSHNLIFDTDAYVKVVAPVADDPAVRSSVADYVAARAVQAVDLGGRLEDALPSAAKMTAPALTRALQQFLRDEIEKFLATDTAKRLWVDINRFAHRQLITALRDQNRYVTVGRHDVKLDLVPLVAVALQRLEEKVPGLLGKDVTLPPIDPDTAPQDIRTLLQDALGRKLPADFGTVTLLHGDQGYELKQALRVFNDLVILVVVVTAVLVVVALLVSVHRRRTALWLGLGALLAFALARVVETQLEKTVSSAIKSSGGAAVAKSVLATAVASLNAFFVWVAVAGAIVVVAAVLAGRPAWLQAMGRAFADLFGVASDLSTPDTRAGRWIHEHLDVLRVGGVVVAVVALLFVTGSVAGVVAVVVAVVVYELALTTYEAGRPRELDQPATDEGDTAH